MLYSSGSQTVVRIPLVVHEGLTCGSYVKPQTLFFLLFKAVVLNLGSLSQSQGFDRGQAFKDYFQQKVKTKDKNINPQTFQNILSLVTFITVRQMPYYLDNSECLNVVISNPLVLLVTSRRVRWMHWWSCQGSVPPWRLITTVLKERWNKRFILNVLPLFLDKISRFLCVLIINKLIPNWNVFFWQ